MQDTTGYELGWDSQIQNDGPEWEALPAGDYDFEVMNFERGRHPGSAKLPPCNKAVLEIRLSGEGGTSTIKHNLFLHSKCEGIICAFFTAIGQRKRGEPLVMNWDKVVGSTGRCKVGIHKWTNKENEEMTGNDIKRFYEPQEPPAQPTAPKPAAQAPPAQTQFKGFTPGKGF